jgi:hypothetical protein
LNNNSEIKDSTYVIYGYGGISRYLVDADGDVYLIKHFSLPAKIKKVKEQGFKVV